MCLHNNERNGQALEKLICSSFRIVNIFVQAHHSSRAQFCKKSIHYYIYTEGIYDYDNWFFGQNALKSEIQCLIKYNKDTTMHGVKNLGYKHFFIYFRNTHTICKMRSCLCKPLRTRVMLEELSYKEILRTCHYLKQLKTPCQR